MAKAAKKSNTRGSKKRPAKKTGEKSAKQAKKRATKPVRKAKKKAAPRAKKAPSKRMAGAMETRAIAKTGTTAKPQTKCRKIDGECIMFGLSPTGYDIPMGKVDCSLCESYF